MKSCIIFIAVSLALWNFLLALGRGEDEFSNDTLAYKLELLNHTFWRTEQMLSSRGVVGPRLDQLRYAWSRRTAWRRNFCAVISILICSMSGSRFCAKRFE